MSDSDLAPGESATPVTARSVRKRFTSKRPAPNRNLDTEPEFDEPLRRGRNRHELLTEAADDDNVCFLCLKAPSGRMEEWRSQMFHHRCTLAIRCHMRLAKKANGSAGTQKAIERYETNPRRWRDEVKPLIADFGNTRSSAARKVARMKVQETATFREERTIKDMTLMTKRRYKSWIGFWEKVASSEASEDFDQKLDGASTQNEDSDGEPRIAIPENEKVRKREGITRSTRTSTQEAEGAAACSSGRGRQGRSSDRRSARVETPRMGRRKAARRKNDDSDVAESMLPSEGADDDSAGDCAEPQPRRAKASRRQEDSPGAARSRSSRRVVSQSLASPSIQGSGSGRDAATARDGNKPSVSKKVSPLELMKQKDALKARTTDVVKKVEKGLVPTLIATAGRESSAHTEKLGATSKSKHAALLAKLNVVQALQAKIDAAKDSNFAELSSKISIAIDELSLSMQEAEDHLAAAKYLFDLDKAGVRTVQQQVGHRKRKLAGKLNSKFGVVKVFSRAGRRQTSSILGRW